MSAWRNVAYGLGDLPRARRRAAALALLDRFGIAELADEVAVLEELGLVEGAPATAMVEATSVMVIKDADGA